MSVVVRMVNTGPAGMVGRSSDTQLAVENHVLRASLNEWHRKFERLTARIADPDHADELAEDIAVILGIKDFKFNE